LTLVDPAAPGAALLAARSDERLEAVEVRPGRALVEAQAGGHLLDEPRGLPVEDELDPRELRRELVERDDAGALAAAGELPLDPLVRDLLGDLRVPGPAAAPDVLVPGELLVRVLVDRLDAMHERAHLLELRPLVVARRQRSGDVDGEEDRQAPPPPPAAAAGLVGADPVGGLRHGALHAAGVARGPGALLLGALPEAAQEPASAALRKRPRD